MKFDAKRADDAVLFFEKYLRHSKGRFAGTLFELREDQADLVRRIFGTLRDDGLRQYRTVYVEIPRKNGKSTLAAGIALKLTLADREPAAEVYSAAADRNQASIVYEEARRMVNQSPPLRVACRVTDSRKNIHSPKTNSFYRVVSADGPAQHGLNPHGVIFDEVHAQRDRSLWEAMTTGFAARSQPLTFAISTAGVIGDSPVWEELHEYSERVLRGDFEDETFLPVLFKPEPNDDIEDPAVWRKVNPGLGSIFSVEDFAADMKRAKRIPAEWNSFLRLRLNVVTSAETAWIPVTAWDACKQEIDWTQYHGRAAFAGLDCSTKSDITAFVVAIPTSDGILLKPRFWLPEKKFRDYMAPWVEGGSLTLTEGNAVDFARVRADVLEDCQKFAVQRILFDPWGPAPMLAQQITEHGIECLEIRFGIKTMTAPTKEFESRVMTRGIRHDGNPCLRWMINNVSIRSDQSGNIIPVKPDRMKSEKRIDGVVASIFALDLVIRDEMSGMSAFNDMNFVSRLMA